MFKRVSSGLVLSSHIIAKLSDSISIPPANVLHEKAIIDFFFSFLLNVAAGNVENVLTRYATCSAVFCGTATESRASAFVKFKIILSLNTYELYSCFSQIFQLIYRY